MSVSVFVCPPPRLLITTGVMWHDWTPYDRLNNGYSFYKAVVVVISEGNGLRIEAHRSNKSKLSLYKLLFLL